MTWASASGWPSTGSTTNPAGAGGPRDLEHRSVGESRRHRGAGPVRGSAGSRLGSEGRDHPGEGAPEPGSRPQVRGHDQGIGELDVGLSLGLGAARQGSMTVTATTPAATNDGTRRRIGDVFLASVRERSGRASGALRPTPERAGGLPDDAGGRWRLARRLRQDDLVRPRDAELTGLLSMPDGDLSATAEERCAVHLATGVRGRGAPRLGRSRFSIADARGGPRLPVDQTRASVPLDAEADRRPNKSHIANRT